MCVLIPTHCTITHFGFSAMWIDGIECGLFSIHAPLGQITLCVGRVPIYLYSVLEEIKVTVCVSVLSGMMMKGREKVKPGAGS